MSTASWKPSDALVKLTACESRATAIFSWEPEVMPGLLQTEEYATAVFRLTRPEFDGSQVAAAVAFRMARQQALRERKALSCDFIIGERAFSADDSGIEAGIIGRQQHQLLHALSCNVRVLRTGTGTPLSSFNLIRDSEHDVLYRERKPQSYIEEKPRGYFLYFETQFKSFKSRSVDITLFKAG
jgi:Domain of unknown function (DUF5753)